MNRVEIARPMLDFSDAGIAAIYTMQVCCVEDASDEEILAVCNSENPAGTSNGWSTVIREDINHDDGIKTEGACACNDFPGRLHILVQC